MEDLPERLDEEALARGLGEFGVRPSRLTYLPVGFGDYHWKVTGADGCQWFATVSDLEHKEHCGYGAAAALEGLRRAMGTAVALREDGLEFVVAPIPATDGEPVVALNGRYALSVFPLAAGEPGQFEQVPTAVQRDRILNLLARMHTSTPPSVVPHTVLEPTGRGSLEAALDEASSAWEGGPFAEPARELIAGRAGIIRSRLDEFDRLADGIRGRGAAHVVTHGEPHLGNVLRTDEAYLLVDWDTVGLAVPERDLSVLSEDPAALTRYTEATGRALDTEALSLYRLRWSLVDLAEFVVWFRSPHERSPDTEAAWKGFTETVDHLARSSSR